MPDEPRSDDPLEQRDSQRWWNEQDKQNDDRPSARSRRPRDEDDYDDREPRPRSNPFGIWSIVLGALSIVCLFFTGIPALILGVMGITRAKQMNGTGGGLSIAGTILGALSIVWTGACFMMLPSAVSKVRSAAARSATVNHAKQVGLGFQSYHDKERGWPRATFDPMKVGFREGRTGLSWRVGLLPYIEEDSLYRTFQLRLSWDSPSNAAASNSVVQAYSHPDDPPTDTRFQVFIGRGTVFDPKGTPSIAAIPDGSSQTIMFAESGLPVPWASPRDMAYTPNGTLPAFGRPGEKVFLVGMADGSVRIVRTNANPKWLHAAIQTSDGVVLPPDWDQ